MITKTFEIRDIGTFIPVLAIQLRPCTGRDRYLLSRAGYGKFGTEQKKYIILCQINGGEGLCKSDPYSWVGRTYPIAHKFIQENFESLETGEVIDIEYILGETKTKKESEMHEK